MKIMKTLLLALPLLVLPFMAAAQVSFGKPESFNDGWLYVLADDPAMKTAGYDDGGWRKLDLPHDWSVEHQLSPDLASCTGYLPGGISWYRKHFSAGDLSERHYVYFEGIYNRSEVYLNGNLLGVRPNGYVSFMYDLTPYLTEGENVIAVRVDHSRYADSRWYTGSGIYRDVWLISAPQIHLSQWGAAYRLLQINDKEAEVEVEYSVDFHERTSDRLKVGFRVMDAGGRLVAKGEEKVGAVSGNLAGGATVLRIKKPHRWNLDDPYLYSLEVILYREDEVVDSCSVPMGLRTLDFDPDKGFALNGEWMKVKGVCLHHDAGVLGAAVPDEVWERRLRNLKKIGVNAVRMSHNPQAPAVYEICDEIGLLVMDEASDEWEFPKRKWLKGWNVGTPGYQGSYDFFEEWIDRDVTDMVRRDRNHPSVFLWSIGNEVDYPNDPYSHPILDGSSISQPMFGGYNPDAPDARRIGKIAKRLAACIKAVDTSRPVTGALAGVVMSNETEYPEAVDVVGYNYTEDRYDMDHEKYPERIIYGSENRPDIDAWYAVKNKDFIFGQFIWTGTDYLGESGPWPSRGFYTGLLDFGSFVKPRGWFRASLWSEDPVTYLGTYPYGDYLSVDAWDDWNFEDGQKIRAVCYTNAPFARLLLDGKVIGEMKPYDPRTGIIYWDIPFSSGELRAEGCDADGNVLSEYTVKTSGRPYSIRAVADRTDVSAGKETVHVVIEILDEKGNMVKLADNNIRCDIEGPAELLGLEGSNNSDMSDYTDNVHRAFRGRLLAYVRSIGVPGNVRLSFTSPLLEPAVVELNVSE